MNIFLGLVVPVFPIFILFPGKVMADVYITAIPRDLDRKVGQSATISVSVSNKIDIREIYLFKNNTNILSLKVQTTILSFTLSFFGTFDKFKWIIEEEDSMDSYVCTDNTEMDALKIPERLTETNHIDCPSPDESSNHMFLNSGSKQIASLRVNPGGYRSRLHISGTIRHLNVTLNDLRIEDTELYDWKGKAEGIPSEVEGEHTILHVRSHGMNIYTGKLGLAFPVALASGLFIYGICDHI